MNEEKDLEVVRKDGLMLRRIFQQTPLLVRAAVEQNGLALEYVYPEYQTEEVYKAAVIKTPRALEWVINQTDKICLTAVRRSGLALQWVRRQTPEIIEAAIAQNLKAKQYINYNAEDKGILDAKQTFTLEEILAYGMSKNITVNIRAIGDHLYSFVIPYLALGEHYVSEESDMDRFKVALYEKLKEIDS